MNENLHRTLWIWKVYEHTNFPCWSWVQKHEDPRCFKNTQSLFVSVLITAETFSRCNMQLLYRQSHRILCKKWRSTKTDTVRWQKLRVWVQFGPMVYGIGWTDIAMCGVKHCNLWGKTLFGGFILLLPRSPARSLGFTILVETFVYVTGFF